MFKLLLWWDIAIAISQAVKLNNTGELAYIGDISTELL